MVYAGTGSKAEVSTEIYRLAAYFPSATAIVGTAEARHSLICSSCSEGEAGQDRCNCTAMPATFSDCFCDMPDLAEGLLARITLADSVNLSLAGKLYRPLLTQKLALTETLSISVTAANVNSFKAALCKMGGLVNLTVEFDSAHAFPMVLKGLSKRCQSLTKLTIGMSQWHFGATGGDIPQAQPTLHLPEQSRHLCFRASNFPLEHRIVFGTKAACIAITRSARFKGADGQPYVTHPALRVDVEVRWPAGQPSPHREATADLLSGTTVRFTVPRTVGDLTIDLEHSLKPEPIQLYTWPTGPLPGQNFSDFGWLHSACQVTFLQAGRLAC